MKHLQPKVNNTGFADNGSTVGNRLVKKDGTPNTRRVGVPFWQSKSWFHTLLKMSWSQFIGVLFWGFVISNLVFTVFYYLVGVHHLNGIVPLHSIDTVTRVFFFSVQTFTTVGYGHISPDGFAASAISSLEAFCGLLYFALATGLLYGRFSKPSAYIKFSTIGLVTPYEGGMALMLRLVPYKNNHLTEAAVRLSLALEEEVNGKIRTNFYQLKTEIDKINSLVLSWTIVHPITDDSPLYSFTAGDFATRKYELLVYIRAFDETFSNTVVARTSYLNSEFVYNAKFEPMYSLSSEQGSTLVNIHKLSLYKQLGG